jgi:hypothetical protein
MLYATVTQRLSDFFPRNLPKEEQVYRNYTLPQQFWPYYTDPSFGSIRYNTYLGDIVPTNTYDVTTKGGYFNYVNAMDSVYSNDGTYKYNLIAGYNRITSVNGNANIYLGSNTTSNAINTENTISIGHNIIPENDKIILRPNSQKGQIKITAPPIQVDVYNLNFNGNGTITYRSSTQNISSCDIEMSSSNIIFEDSKLKLTESTIAIGNSAVSDRSGMYSVMHSGFASSGDSQKSNFLLRGTTTSNSYQELFTNGSSLRMTIPSGKFWSGIINILGIRDNGENCARYMRQVTIGNVGGTTSLYGTTSAIGSDIHASKVIGLTTHYTDNRITANNTGDYLSIEVYGLPSENMRWLASADGIELEY